MTEFRYTIKQVEGSRRQIVGIEIDEHVDRAILVSRVIVVVVMLKLTWITVQVSKLLSSLSIEEASPF